MNDFKSVFSSLKKNNQFFISLNDPFCSSIVRFFLNTILSTKNFIRSQKFCSLKNKPNVHLYAERNHCVTNYCRTKKFVQILRFCLDLIFITMLIALFKKKGEKKRFCVFWNLCLHIGNLGMLNIRCLEQMIICLFQHYRVCILAADSACDIVFFASDPFMLG